MGTDGHRTGIPSRCNGGTTSNNFCWVIESFCTEETMLEVEIINIDFLVYRIK